METTQKYTKIPEVHEKTPEPPKSTINSNTKIRASEFRCLFLRPGGEERAAIGLINAPPPIPAPRVYRPMARRLRAAALASFAA